MRRYFLYCSFLGKNYHGWQIQPNAISVQQRLQEAISTYYSKKVEVVGAGRTDTGVHAKLMVAHFDLNEEIDSSQFCYKVNAILPNDIVINEIKEVNSDFHARFDAVSRSYEYYVAIEDNPFLLDMQYRHHAKLDVENMNIAARMILGKHDFSCFSKSKTQTFTNDCEIYKAEWSRLPDNRLLFRIKANRFLRNMVRAIVGTLIEVGEGKRSVESILTLLASKSRSKAGTSVPAKGLFLSEIEYPKEGFIQ